MPRKEIEPVEVIEAEVETDDAPPTQLTQTVYTPPAMEPDPDGYYPAADWVRITCDWERHRARDGFAPLWAEFDISLTFAEAMAIPDPFNTTLGELAPHICPRVRAWNVRMRDPESGQTIPVPPPAEAGVAAFVNVRTGTMQWLAFTLKTLHLGGGPNRGNATTPSADGSDGPSDDA